MLMIVNLARGNDFVCARQPNLSILSYFESHIIIHTLKCVSIPANNIYYTARAIKQLVINILEYPYTPTEYPPCNYYS